MGELLIPLEIAAGIAVVALLVFVALLVRRLMLYRRPGTFDLSVRPVGGVWSVGVAQFGSTQLDFYPFFSLSLGPSQVFERDRLRIVGRRESVGVLSSTVVIRCRFDGDEIDLAMSESAYFGLSTWSEAAPPGQRHHLI